MTRTAGAQIGCQRLSRFWGLGCPKIYHEAEDTLAEDCSCFFRRCSPSSDSRSRREMPGRGVWRVFMGYRQYAKTPAQGRGFHGLNRKPAVSPGYRPRSPS
ncbi:hypothetical protein [Thiolapillus sp.]|uniref:hypothetical protein n=1 Tax=Thiolapillus sp. TaxID=2017437 RepID=UPI0025EF5968|nr:hypothetical protein [Thiolapillus sp.]